MRVNEVKQTKTIEEVVRTEYIAEDGTVFRSEEECRKYEESALFAISKELKRLTNPNEGSENDIYDQCSVDDLVEVFNAETEKDIENIRRYVYLRALHENRRVDQNCVELPNITAGHEIIIHWSYELDACWVFGDGSINAFCNYIRNNLTAMITPKDKQ